MNNIMLRAAMMALSIATVPPAFASGIGPAPDGFMTGKGAIVQGPAQFVPSIAPARQVLLVDADSRSGHGPWLFPPISQYAGQRQGP
jgi:hypothetical protein